MVTSPESTTMQVLERQLGARYARHGPADRARHAAMLDAITRPDDVELHAEPRGDRWLVTVCTADALGALSIIAGLFTIFQLDIPSADIYTLRFPPPGGQRSHRGQRHRPRPTGPAPGPPTRKLLDIFEIRPLAALKPDDWTNLRAELRALIGLLTVGRRDEARDRVVDRVSRALPPAATQPATLLPVAVAVDLDSATQTTRLTVRSADTPGFLFAFTNALTGFTINIERAEVRTTRGEARDTLWVTDLRGEAITNPDQVHTLRVATALIKQFTYLLPRAPDPGLALRQFNALIAQVLSRPQWTADLANLESPAVLETLADMLGVSRFLWEDFLRMQHESLFPVVLDLPALRQGQTAADLANTLATHIAASPPAARVDVLNAVKDRELFRIDLRHITGYSDFTQFAEELTALADVTVAAAAELVEADLRQAHGRPALIDGQPCPWALFGLGKFGGRELGFGSDLELIVVYRDDGRTTGPNAISNAEYYSRFVQQFLAVLRARQEGIFEVDLRLRPHGKGGPLASTVSGFADYYLTRGAAEQFERMALVRLRPVAGDAEIGAQVIAARDAFVYSGRPLDLENVRHLRRRQATELVPSGQISAKYSAGGLVDVEYYTQAWQVGVGAAAAAVRTPSTLAAIDQLTQLGYLPTTLGERLRATYGFLRRLIDALRVVRGNAKDLTLPAVESREYTYLAQRLKTPTIDELTTAIQSHMATAREVWDAHPPPSSPPSPG